MVTTPLPPAPVEPERKGKLPEGDGLSFQRLTVPRFRALVEEHAVELARGLYYQRTRHGCRACLVGTLIVHAVGNDILGTLGDTPARLDIFKFHNLVDTLREYPAEYLAGLEAGFENRPFPITHSYDVDFEAEAAAAARSVDTTHPNYYRGRQDGAAIAKEMEEGRL